jgi:hypothetical protein
MDADVREAGIHRPWLGRIRIRQLGLDAVRQRRFELT